MLFPVATVFRADHSRSSAAYGITHIFLDFFPAFFLPGADRHPGAAVPAEQKATEQPVRLAIGALERLQVLA